MSSATPLRRGPAAGSAWAVMAGVRVGRARWLCASGAQPVGGFPAPSLCGLLRVLPSAPCGCSGPCSGAGGEEAAGGRGGSPVPAVLIVRPPTIDPVSRLQVRQKLLLSPAKSLFWRLAPAWADRDGLTPSTLWPDRASEPERWPRRQGGLCAAPRLAGWRRASADDSWALESLSSPFCPRKLGGRARRCLLVGLLEW